MIEEIQFSPTLSIWKTLWDVKNIDEIRKCAEHHILSNPDSPMDVYTYYKDSIDLFGEFNREIKDELDGLLNLSINRVIKLFSNPYNYLSTDVWINVVRAKNPVQNNYTSNGDLIFHKHSDLNIKMGRLAPNYTFVSYIQMPNNLIGDDGVLFLKDNDNNVFKYLPKVGDCIIMKGDVPHVPNIAKNSTIDRMVLAGNVRLDLVKKQKTIF